MNTAANDLYSPLGMKSEAKPKGFRLGMAPALIAAGVVLGVIAVWVVAFDDPLGGEPRGHVRMPRIPAPPTATPMPQPTAVPAATPTPAPAQEPVVPEGQAQISIITPGGVNGMNVRTVIVPDGQPSRALRSAPDPRLVEKNRFGLLPKIGADGTRPSRFYARVAPATTDMRVVNAPKIAILIGGLGLSTASTNDAISRLPPDVTLAFAPYGGNLQAQVNRARLDGHEVMLQLPMEPFDFPSSDPGPQTLLTSLSPEQNLDRLYWSLARFSGFTGVTNYMGAKLTSTPAALRPILAELKARGLVYADDGSSPRSVANDLARELGLGAVHAGVTIDAVPTPQKIDEALATLEEQARRDGSALGVAAALPISIERLARWVKDLDRKGIVLVPVSAIVTGERN